MKTQTRANAPALELELPEIERRYLPIHDLELRVEGDDEKLTFSGYAAVFNQLSEDLGGWRELVAPGAFTKTLRESADVRMLLNHNPDFLLARSASKTLHLEEDARGLKVSAEMAPVSYARDLSVLIERGDLTQMSFGFRVIKRDWQDGDDEGELIRVLREVQLFDVSPVTFPAYPQTTAEVREYVERMRAGGQVPPAVRALRELVEPEAYGKLLDGLRDGRVGAEHVEAVRGAIASLEDLLPEAAEPEDREVVHSLPLELAKRKLALRERSA